MNHENRDPREIEQELEATRARMNRTLNEIEDRLSPGQLVDQAMSYFKNGPARQHAAIR